MIPRSPWRQGRRSGSGPRGRRGSGVWRAVGDHNGHFQYGRENFPVVARVLAELSSDLDFILSWVPGAVGYRLRRWYLGRRFRSLGPKARFGIGAQIIGPQNLTIGSNFTCWHN